MSTARTPWHWPLPLEVGIALTLPMSYTAYLLHSINNNAVNDPNVAGKQWRGQLIGGWADRRHCDRRHLCVGVDLICSGIFLDNALQKVG